MDKNQWKVKAAIFATMPLLCLSIIMLGFDVYKIFLMSPTPYAAEYHEIAKIPFLISIIIALFRLGRLASILLFFSFLITFLKAGVLDVIVFLICFLAFGGFVGACAYHRFMKTGLNFKNILTKTSVFVVWVLIIYAIELMVEPWLIKYVGPLRGNKYEKLEIENLFHASLAFIAALGLPLTQLGILPFTRNKPVAIHRLKQSQ